MTKEFVYEKLKAYYTKNFENFQKYSEADQKKYLDRYWGGFCDIAMFAQTLGLSYEEVKKVYEPYYNKFWELKTKKKIKYEKQKER